MARVIRPLQVDSQPRYATPVRYATPSRSAACRHATPGRLSPQPVPCGWAGWAPPPHPGWVAIPMAYSQVQPPAQSPAELAVGVTVRIGSVQCVISEPLGMGSFGVVWAARCDGKSKEVAVKEMICSNETELHRAEYEISLLKTLSELVPAPLRIPSLVSSEVAGPRVRLAMSRLPGITLDHLFTQGEFSTEEAVASARALLQQLAPTMAAISQVTYHRDVNAHNILVQAAAGGEGRAPSYGLVDFGLAVDASGWCDPSPSNPGGKSEWEFLDVGGDCRYWPVSAWRQFEAGCRALVQEDFLCVEYQTHLDLQGLGLTAVQVLSSMLPGDLKVPELKRLQELWQLYWEDASCYWASLLDTFRHGGDWTALKQDFVARKVYRIMADRLRSLRTALSDALEAAAAANLSGEDSWPPGSASLFWALLAMISCGERMDSSWQEVCSRISCRGQPPVCSRLPAPVNSEVGMLGYLSKLRNLTAKVHELSLDFDRLLPAMGEAR